MFEEKSFFDFNPDGFENTEDGSLVYDATFRDQDKYKHNVPISYIPLMGDISLIEPEWMGNEAEVDEHYKDIVNKVFHQIENPEDETTEAADAISEGISPPKAL
ncbi:hypothetical protein [Paenibacillus periandrae]|uniref:hypothetical protein n=1 Tax=Paenibacillus periandrae TaxID=1761741 RepID=UPI001F091AD0|nr:hypothetical protein [Paenibacillus periandrae]